MIQDVTDVSVSLLTRLLTLNLNVFLLDNYCVLISGKLFGHGWCCEPTYELDFALARGLLKLNFRRSYGQGNSTITDHSVRFLTRLTYLHFSVFCNN